MVDNVPIYLTSVKDLTTIVGSGQARGRSLLTLLFIKFGKLVENASRIVKSFTDDSFNIHIAGKFGEVNIDKFLKLNKEDFEFANGTELHDIITEVERQLGSKLVKYFNKLTGDDAALIKYFAFLDSYLYNAKLLSKAIAAYTASNIKQFLPVDPTNSKFILGRLEITVHQRKHKGYSKFGNNIFFRLSDPNPNTKYHRSQSGIEIELLKSKEAISPKDRTIYKRFENGFTLTGGKSAFIALLKEDGRSYYKSDARNLSQVMWTLSILDQEIKDILTIDPTTGRVTNIIISTLLKSKSLMNKILDLQLFLTSGRKISTYREALFGGADTKDISPFLRSMRTEDVEIANTNKLLDTILEIVINRHDKPGLINKIRYVSDTTAEKLITPEVVKISKNEFMSEYIRKVQDIIFGIDSVVRRIGLGEGYIIDVLDIDVLKKINNKNMGLNVLLQKVFKYKLGNVITEAQALELANRILTKSKLTRIKVGELENKISYGSGVKPSSSNTAHNDSYEVITQRIANGYNKIIREDRCDVKSACIEFDSAELLKATSQEKYKPIVEAIIQNNGDFEKIFQDNLGADYKKDKDAAEFLFLMYTTIDNSKGMEASIQSFHRGINKLLNVVPAGDQTTLMKIQNKRLLKASGNNPLVGHLLKTDPKFYSAFIGSLFSSTEFKNEKVTVMQEGPDYTSLASMKTYYTRQFTGNNIPENKNKILKNTDEKIVNGRNINQIGLGLEVKKSDSKSLSVTAGSKMQSAQFNELYRGNFDIKLLKLESKLSSVKQTDLKKSLVSFLGENLKQLEIFGQSEFKGRLVNNKEGLTATLTGDHNFKEAMMIDFIKALRATRNNSQASPVKSLIDRHPITLSSGVDLDDFNLYFKREIEHINNLTNWKNSILDNINTIIGQTVSGFADSISNNDLKAVGYLQV